MLNLMAPQKNRDIDRILRSAKNKAADLAEDQASLWAEVTKTVEKKNRSHILPAHIPEPVKKTKSKAEKAPQPQLSASHRLVTPPQSSKAGVIQRPADLSQAVHPGIDRSSARKIQQGRMTIDARLDLHGLSQLQARQRLQQFIYQSLQLHHRTLLIITGKGKAGRGVLREQVPIWLAEAPLNDVIIAFGPSRPQDGGAGALYVRLKRARENQ